MILPSKHIKLCESLIGLSSFLYELLTSRMTVDELWRKFNKKVNAGEFPTQHSFDNFILAIDLLYILSRVELSENKILRNEVN